jgi:hypothetical protein
MPRFGVVRMLPVLVPLSPDRARASARGWLDGIGIAQHRNESLQTWLGLIPHPGDYDG